MDVTVIILDWGVGASADYVTAARYVPSVGEKVGQMINWLNDLGVPFSNFHLVGYSLGGHISGIGGRTARGTVEYISGIFS